MRPILTIVIELGIKDGIGFQVRLRLVRVKVFPENILFSRNAIFRKGKCFHMFGCISKNVSENIF